MEEHQRNLVLFFFGGGENVRVVDLVGRVFGRLTVTGRAENTADGQTRWLCKCSCGNNVTVLGSNLKRGITRSCGCLALEQRRKAKLSNDFIFHENYVSGFTSTGVEFWIDTGDYETVKRYCWHVDAQGYITGRVRGRDITLHRFLLGAKDGDIIDHISHNKRDDRKGNLRIVGQSRNMQNSKLSKANKSGVTGVSWFERDQKWRASITVNYKAYNLGTYDTFEEAVAARKAAEEKYFGEYSYDNSMAASPVIEVA